MIYELKDVCTPLKGTQIDTTLLSDNNPFKYINGGTKESGFYIESNTPGNTVIVSEGGASCGYVNYIDTEFWCGCHCYKLVEPKINAKYLYYALKANQSRIMELRTGAAMPNIKKSTFIHFKLDLTNDKEEQNAIVSELDKIQAALDNKKEQLKKLDELIQSKFYEMFGDIVTNNKGWPIEKLEDVGSFARGVSKHRPRNAPELLGGTMPLIQTGDIANAGMYITTYSTTYSDLGVLQSKVWPAGTLCITIAANIGKCSILTFDACFPDSVVGYTIKQNKIKNEFVYYLFGELQAILEANALGVAQKNINLKTLNSLEVPLPPLPLQQAFAAYVEKVEQAKAIVNQEIAHLQELLNSRMDYYFRK